MKTGRDIGQLWQEVLRQSQSKRDLTANTTLLQVRTRPYIGGTETLMGLGDMGEMPVNDYALGQLLSHVGIPKTYADRMRTFQPGLFDRNVNTWLSAADAGERRMVRTLDGNVRAFLSDRYRRLDNFDLLKFMIPELRNLGEGLNVDSCEVTDKRLYLKITSPRLQREVKVNDIVQMGIIIQNSEVGAGMISVLPFSNRLKCLNGMVHQEYGKRRHHVGKRVGGEDEGIAEFFTDETRAADDMAFFLKIRDVTRACLGDIVIGRVVQQMQIADGIEIPEPVSAIDIIAQKEGFTEEIHNLVVENMLMAMESKVVTLYDIAQAITRTAADQDDYDIATDLEILGGKVISLDKSEWRELVDAAPDRTHRRRSTALAVR